MNLLDNIGTDGRREDGRKRVSRARGLTLGRGDGDCRSGRHCCRQGDGVVVVVEFEVESKLEVSLFKIEDVDIFLVSLSGFGSQCALS